MPQDVKREGGEAAVHRSLSWLVDRSTGALEPSVEENTRHAAFNITVFSQLLGTPLQPDLTGHVLMLEEVAEHTYRTDRSMFNITSNPAIRRVAGIRPGRCTRVPANSTDLGDRERDCWGTGRQCRRSRECDS